MTEQNRTCPRCKAPYKPDYNYCAICGLKLNPEQKAAARTTAHEVKLTLDGKVVGQQIVGEINRLSAIRRRHVGPTQ